ncbi:MAG: hypothetical protein ACKOE6_09160 [Flammeovirgaceae bacterium]
MKKVLVFLVLSIAFTACGNRIIYYGRQYPATQNVDIFFRESDVKEPNEIMGKVTLEMSARKSSDKIQRKLMKRAQSTGADAIIFDNISLTTTGSTTGAAAAGTAKRGWFFGIFGSKTKYDKGQQVNGTLLKYKKNIGS